MILLCTTAVHLDIMTTSKGKTDMATTILPHETAQGPRNKAEWKKLLQTAPRDTDSVGRPTIQVCTASDGRGIFSTVEYATDRAGK
jgi:hypothetical protein